jgi:hypothetical protein
LLIYKPVGGTASLSSITAAINAAAAADPNTPAIATAPETPAAPRNARSQRRIAPVNLSPTPQSVSGRPVAAANVSGPVLRRGPPGRAASRPVSPTPAPCNLRQRAQNIIHG